MNKIINGRILLPLGFFLFISYIIFLADTADYNMGFALVEHLPYGDKIMHALLYGVMAMLLNYGLGYRQIGRLQLGAVMVLSFAIIEECTQYYIPTRSFDLLDMLADLVGVMVFSWKKITL